MRNNKMLLWKVSLSKGDKTKIFKELYFMGEFLIQVSHNAEFLIYGAREHDINPMFDFDVNIMSIERVKEIDDIVNAHNVDDDDFDEDEEYDPEIPYRAYDDVNFPQSMKVEITCSCGNKQKIGLFNFPYTKCHDCQRTILRKDISEIGGLIIYTPSN